MHLWKPGQARPDFSHRVALMTVILGLISNALLPPLCTGAWHVMPNTRGGKALLLPSSFSHPWFQRALCWQSLPLLAFGPRKKSKRKGVIFWEYDLICSGSGEGERKISPTDIVIYEAEFLYEMLYILEHTVHCKKNKKNKETLIQGTISP